MIAVPPQRSGPDTDSVAVTLARLEGKVDVVLAQQGAKLDNHGDDIADHETRLRLVEAKSTVSPRTLWTAVASTVAVLATISPLLERLYSIHP